MLEPEQDEKCVYSLVDVIARLVTEHKQGEETIHIWTKGMVTVTRKDWKYTGRMNLLSNMVRFSREESYKNRKKKIKMNIYY